MKHFAFKAVVGIFLLLAGSVSWWLLRPVVWHRVDRPDEQYYAVAKYRKWRSYMPMSPGSGSDKPGYVTVYTKDGKSCGSAPISFVRKIDELKWSSNRVEIGDVAEWDLERRKIIWSR